MNLRAVSGDRYDADHMKFRLKRLRQMTGASEQALIFRFLHLGWDACPDFRTFMEEIEREWAAMKKQNNT